MARINRKGPHRAGRFGLHRGTGRRFRASVKALEQAKLDTDSELFIGAQASAGNGCAMFVAPVAWVGSDFSVPLLNTCRIKTTDIRAIAGAYAVAFLVSHGIEHGNFDSVLASGLCKRVQLMEDAAAAALGKVENVHTFSDALGGMLDRLSAGQSEDQVISAIAAEARRKSEGPRLVYQGSGYAPASVVMSVYYVVAPRGQLRCRPRRTRCLRPRRPGRNAQRRRVPRR